VGAGGCAKCCPRNSKLTPATLVDLTQALLADCYAVAQGGFHRFTVSIRQAIQGAVLAKRRTGRGDYPKMPQGRINTSAVFAAPPSSTFPSTPFATLGFRIFQAIGSFYFNPPAVL